jgi:hypothetical protein
MNWSSIIGIIWEAGFELGFSSQFLGGFPSADPALYQCVKFSIFHFSSHLVLVTISANQQPNFD